MATLRCLGIIVTLAACHTAASAGTIHVPGDVPTIQQAVDAAQDGDVILVAPGQYYENVVVYAVSFTLISEAGPEVTSIIAADPTLPVLELNVISGPPVVIDGFTFNGGSAGVDAFWSDAAISHCTLANNAGPGVRGMMSSVDLSGCLVEFNGNTSVNSGGVSMDLSFLSLEDTTVANNRGNFGGGARVNETVVDIHTSEFLDNEANNGGALHIGLATATISESRFVRNTALDEGGALRVASVLGTTVDITDTTMLSNSAASGGAMFVGLKVTTIVSMTHFCDNQPEHILGDWSDGGGNVMDDVCRASGDLNGDGNVNVSDLLILLGAWGDCERTDQCPTDLNDDGSTTTCDMLILLANWS